MSILQNEYRLRFSPGNESNGRRQNRQARPPSRMVAQFQIPKCRQGVDLFAAVGLAENCLLLRISSAARAAKGTGFCRCSSPLRRPPDMCEVEWCTLYVCPDILPPKT